MNDQKNENTTDTKLAEQDTKYGITEYLLMPVLPLAFLITSYPACSVALGAAMMVWHDILDGVITFFSTSPKGAIVSIVLWIIWNRPIGAFIIICGLYTIWDRKFSKSKIEETE
jgi:hypothetical protein